MISINLERDQIEDLEYNIANHLEKQETNVVDIKHDIFQDVPSGDMVASIKEIKEEDLEHADVKIHVLIATFIKKRWRKMY